MTDFIDTVVIGAGVVGIAIAREFALMGHDTILLEAESSFGHHTSSRNSEVIHAGIYYPKGSLKANMCRLGKHLLYDYCAERSVPFKQLGKIIVATSDDQLKALKNIQQKALGNDVTDLRELTSKDILEIEPYIEAQFGLYSPSTGILDSHSFMQSILGDFENAGGIFCAKSEFLKAHFSDSGFILDISAQGEQYNLKTKNLINSGGLKAWDIASSIDQFDNSFLPARYYARGDYYKLSKNPGISRLIYPVPVNGGLGVHVTLDLQGQLKLGPDVSWMKAPEYESQFGREEEIYAAAERYFPAVREYELFADYSGIRPKLSGPNEPATDFCISTSQQHGLPGLVNLFGIESPGLTSSLGLAKHVANSIQD